MTLKNPKRIRLDKLLFEKNLVESREMARALILEGNVSVDGFVASKPGTLTSPEALLEIKNKIPYVSRGGLKLRHAIDTFKINPANKIAMDVGASTGGFTDCLLQHGARKVYAVDVGYGQFDWRLRNDDRIVLLEKTNIRYLDNNLVPDAIDIAAIDVSFISLLKVLPKVLELLAPDGEIAALIKPQFEAGRKDVGKGGVIKDENTRHKVVEKIKTECEKMGLKVIGTVESPIKGPKGNVEYMIYMKK